MFTSFLSIFKSILFFRFSLKNVPLDPQNTAIKTSLNTQKQNEKWKWQIERRGKPSSVRPFSFLKCKEQLPSRTGRKNTSQELSYLDPQALIPCWLCPRHFYVQIYLGSHLKTHWLPFSLFSTKLFFSIGFSLFFFFVFLFSFSFIQCRINHVIDLAEASAPSKNRGRPKLSERKEWKEKEILKLRGPVTG